MQNHPAIPHDEISLFDLWQTLVRRKWWVLGTPLLAVIAATVAVTLMQPQWEAIADIQIGAVGQAGQLIEPVSRVVARMKLKSFEDAVLTRLTPSDTHDPEARLYRRSIEVTAPPNTDLVQLKVRGYSKESAKRSVEMTVGNLQKIHKQMAAPTVQRMRQFLAQVEQEIAQTKAEREKSLKIMGLKDKAISQVHFMENIVLGNIMVQRDRDLYNLERTKTEYEKQLDPLHTYPTSYIEKISVSEEPVAPKKLLSIVLAGVLGLLLGVMAAFLSNAFQVRK